MTNPYTPAEADPHYIETTTHNFKTHASRYIRMLEEGRADGLILKRYHTAVAMLLPIK